MEIMEKKITLHDKSFRPFIPYEEIEKAIDAVAEELNRDYADASEADAPILLCTLNGAVMFAAELLKRISFPCIFKAAKMSSYVGTSSTGVVRGDLAAGFHYEGKRVIVIEDIVDTGNTIVAMTAQLRELGAREVKVCTLLVKPDVYDKDVKLDYVAMRIPNRFIVGFGLDYDDLGRNIKDIYVLDD
jgi:hypoxanthine phosphoribosyltransferase